MSEGKNETDQTNKVTEELQETEANLTKPSDQIIESDNHSFEQDLTATADKKKLNLYKLLRIVFFLGFVIFAILFINEVFLTPYRINKSIEKTNNLYKTNRYYSSVTATPAPTLPPFTDNSVVDSDVNTTTKLPVYDPTRDDKGRLLQFADLLAVNEDVKGWITVPDTNIDYVVMQSGNDDPEYYLTRDIEKQELKAGSLFLDYKCSVEANSKNMTIHGHNMTSTDNMFHYLIKFKELEYYKERPVFTFDTILQTGQWKIFAIFITNGGSEKEDFFNYTRSD
ncbi:MAG: hypothetical protein H6Q59_1525, partial [Firmicutes bacterium]|nr:hypothetical protein [Bacillota bacterium]